MHLSSLQNGSDIRGVAMGPQANLTAKAVDSISRAFALWLIDRTPHTIPRCRWDGCQADRPGLEKGLHCGIGRLRPFRHRLRHGQHARYVYDDGI